MGRIILCTSVQAKNPYVLPVSETKIYTIEELCYYVYHNIYEITVDYFGESLVKWLREELGLTMVAKKLQVMMDNEADLKDRVITLMCSCDYYSEEDIKALLHIISDMENMPFHGRMKIKADYLLKYGKYVLAKREYDRLLNGGYAVNLSPQEYGNILHNRSMACFYTGAYGEAVEGFRDAYSRNNNKKTLKHYLYALLLNSEKAKYESELVRYNVSSEEADEIVEVLSTAFEEAEKSEEYKEVIKIKKYAQSTEAYDYAGKKLETWKSRYREGNS